MKKPFPADPSDELTDLWHECVVWCERENIGTGTLISALRFVQQFAEQHREVSAEWGVAVRAVIATGKF